MRKMKRLSVLGSTGSIGTQTLDVCRNLGYSVVALAAGSNAELLEKHDIFKAAIAKKAIPYCNVTLITGDNMKSQLIPYLQVLFEANPASVGGALPDDTGFYINQ